MSDFIEWSNRQWLALRQGELKRALELKERGVTQIWPYDDYCLDIDDYIKEKQEVIKQHLEKRGEE
jgi:hypothetical protein